MPSTGRITRWDDSRGFGFITPDQPGADVFVHISSLQNSSRRPADGDPVRYTVQTDHEGRLKAESVEFTDQPSTPSRHSGRSRSRSGYGYLVVPVGFLLAVAACTALGWIPFWLMVADLVLSLISLVLYALDKRAAKRNLRRTPEATLHLLSLLGGWPGAWLAQHWLRHKTIKLSFRIAFFITVTLNVLAHVGVMKNSGPAPMDSRPATTDTVTQPH